MSKNVFEAEELRLLARLQVLRHCPDYFILFDPVSRSFASEEDITEAKRNLIKARYPKFYSEIFEDEE